MSPRHAIALLLFLGASMAAGQHAHHAMTLDREGMVMNTNTEDLPRVKLISEMLGHELTQTLHKQTASEMSKHKNQEAFIRVENLGRKGYLEPLDLSVGEGEIVGLAGLLGSGRTETALLIFGIESRDQGTIYVDGKPVNLRAPSQAIQEGFALCPEDRKTEGIVGELTVRENIILALQAKRGWFDFIPIKRQQELADEMIEALHIATPDAEKPAGQLSGGNQQKLILARWLASEPKFLILDEPTRGIDVGAHAEIINIIKRLSKEGLSLLVISSELAEVVDYSNRVIVLRDRKMVAELRGDDVNENRIMQVIAEEPNV